MRLIKRNPFKRLTALTIALSILFVCAVGYTIAYLVMGTNPIINIFAPSEVKTSVVLWESNSGNYDGIRCRVRNESDITAYLRAVITVNWKMTDEDGNEHIHAVAPIEGTDYELKINESRWIEKKYSNGEVIYYHKSPVGPKVGNDYGTGGLSDHVLFNDFKQLSSENQPEGYELVVEVLGSGIQSSPVSTVEEQWGVEIGDDGNITAVND